MQDAVSIFNLHAFKGRHGAKYRQAFAITLCGWLGGFGKAKEAELLTIEEVGMIMKGKISVFFLTLSRSMLKKVDRPVPVNLKEDDSFHLTIEEYLHALISLIDELVRIVMR